MKCYRSLNLVYFCNEKVLVKSEFAFEFVEAIKIFTIGGVCDIVCYVYVLPKAVVVNPIPCMKIGSIGSRHSVNYIARDILTTTKRRKQMGEVIAETFSGS